MLSITSRYAGIGTATLEVSEDRTIVYLERRFLPQPERFTEVAEHVVSQNERLDNITALYLNDPEQFWRVADANAAMRPEELTERIGRRLRITLPEGLGGAPNV